MSQESTIRRGVRNARYAAIPNHVFEDDRLSMEARWLLGYLLSKPDNWTVIIGDIIKKGGCGRDKARKMIAELVEFGYAEREQARADGKFGASMLVIFDEPRAPASEEQPGEGESVAFLPQTEMPAPVKPSPVLPSPVKSALSNNLSLANTDSHQEREERRESVSVGEDARKVEAAFWNFVKDWPNFGPMGKEPARKLWFALSAEERRNAVERYAGWRAMLKAAKRDHVPTPQTYFRERLWEGVPDAPAASAPSDARGIAKVCGKLWMGTRLEALSSEPTGKIILTTFDEKRIADGVVSREQLLRDKRKEHGWPIVSAMRDLARRREVFITSLALLPHVGNFRQAHRERDSELISAWGRLHERKGWPFIEHPPEWVYFPPVDEAAGDLDTAVEAALTNFVSAINEGRNPNA
jgi:hypothetical protein